MRCATLAAPGASTDSKTISPATIARSGPGEGAAGARRRAVPETSTRPSSGRTTTSSARAARIARYFVSGLSSHSTFTMTQRPLNFATER
jgi:hypothetical protein